MDENSGLAEDAAKTLRQLFRNTGVEAKLAFIGGGKMATALIRGFESAGLVNKDCVAVSVRTQSSVQRWKVFRSVILLKQLGYENVYTCNDSLIQTHGQGIIFLSIKPQMRLSILQELSNEAFINTPLIVSIMCGISLKTLETEVATKGYPLERGVVRLMPNLPVTVCSGASIMCSSPHLQQEKIALIDSVMQHVGICLEVSEKVFDAASAIAGCGPAFVFMAIEALANGGVLGGIDCATSMKLAAQTVMASDSSFFFPNILSIFARENSDVFLYIVLLGIQFLLFQGAAKMVLELDKHPAALKDDVCSAGGTTIYGVKELEKNGFRSSLIEAVNASTKRNLD
uniref:pyrroline-5-carboxylate reductase n=1 Tax=Setaria digitata TaxID=48799 RepID=A0A915PBR1_9BILA